MVRTAGDKNQNGSLQIAVNPPVKSVFIMIIAEKSGLVQTHSGLEVHQHHGDSTRWKQEHRPLLSFQCVSHYGRTVRTEELRLLATALFILLSFICTTTNRHQREIHSVYPIGVI